MTKFGKSQGEFVGADWIFCAWQFHSLDVYLCHKWLGFLERGIDLTVENIFKEMMRIPKTFVRGYINKWENACLIFIFYTKYMSVKKKSAIFYQSIFFATEFTLYFPVFWSFLCNYRQFRAILILRQVIINKVKMDLQSI